MKKTRLMFGVLFTLLLINIEMSGQTGSIVLTSTIDSINCYGGCDAEIDINITGGTSPYSIEWSTGDTALSIDSLCEGDYYVTVSGQNSVPVCPWTISGIMSQQFIYSEINTVLCGPASIGDTLGAFCYDSSGAAICVGLSDIFTTSGLIHWMYFYKDDPATPQKDGLAIGDIISFKLYRFGDGSIVDLNLFTVLYSSDQCFPSFCDDYGSSFVRFDDYSSATTSYQVVEHFEIVNPPELNLTKSNSPIFCFNDQANVTFSISGGTPPYFIPNDTVLNAGIYSYIAEDSLGCLDTLTFTLTQPDELVLIPIFDPIVCNGDVTAVTFDASGGTPPYLLPDNDNYVSGSYYNLIVRDTRNCTDTITLDITEPNEIIIDTLIFPASSISANDGAIDLTVSGGITPYTFNWSNGEITEDIENLETGNYSVELIDSLGCIKTDSFNVPYTQTIPINSNSKLEIYPNPGVNNLYIELNNNKVLEKIILLDIRGRVVIEQYINEGITIIDVNHLEPATYFIKLIGKEQISTFKWLKY